MEPGKIITFYSYKGGTGRTMALANIACLLAERDDCKRGILMIDWDLEAPGLHRFFVPQKYSPSDNVREDQFPGLIDLWLELKEALEKTEGKTVRKSKQQVQDEIRRINIRQYSRQISLDSLSNDNKYRKLFLMRAGQFSPEYSGKVSRFPWEDLFRISPWVYSAFAEELMDLFDYILIDSRTGITDTSGICTMIMPEKLVVVFTPNSQSLTGVPDLISRAVNYRKVSDDLRPLVVYPLPSRIENSEEALKNVWRFGNQDEGIQGYQNQFEKLFKSTYDLENPNLS